MPDYIFPSAKAIRDPIYGYVRVPRDLLPLLHHPLVQRLRWISQTSLAQMVYPGAVHTRFEHSIGTMHLAYISALSLWNYAKQNPTSLASQKFLEEVADNKDDFVKATMIAALLHDIGHAPFSHVYEFADDSYDHETVGHILARKVLDDCTSRDDIYSQWALMALDKSKDLASLPVASQVIRSLLDGQGIDIDKGDYVPRDAYHCGVPYGQYGWQRLWTNLALHYDEAQNVVRLAISAKAVHEAYHLMIARFHMYEAVYEHHTKQKIDAAVAYFLKRSKSVLGLKARDIEDDPLKLVNWVDGYIISQLVTSPALGDAFTKILNRELPQLSEVLDELTLVLPPLKSRAKAMQAEIKREIWKLVEDAEGQFYPYFLIPEEPFPSHGLYETKVVDRAGVSSLFDYLEIYNITVREGKMDDLEGVPRSQRLRIRAFTYDDDAVQDFREPWNRLKQLKDYTDLLESS